MSVKLIWVSFGHLLDNFLLTGTANLSFNCSHSSYIKRKVRVHGDYVVIFNAFNSQRCPPCDREVTITTHGGLGYLRYVPILAENWQAAISFALYVPNEAAFQIATSIMATMQTCSSHANNFATVHFYFPKAEANDSAVLERRLEVLKETRMAVDEQEYTEECGVSSTPWTKHVIPQSALSKQVPYPINAGRNIAIEGATTMYILPSDVKLVPGPRFLSHKFLRMIRERRDLKLEERPDVAFALHLFEVDDKTGDFPMPDKRILMENIRTRRAFRFHIKGCKECYTMPFADEWERGLGPDGSPVEPRDPTSDLPVRIHSKATREGTFAAWDPIVIAMKSAFPRYDERLTWQGKRDRKPQMFEMCAQNFTFAILEEGFLVHQPGVKPLRPQPEWRKAVISRQSALIDGQIRAELVAKYPDAADRCSL
ncbi:unnamed protein product [Notodromas monacha]|uniref:Glycosyltransferase n=1 Tax=Notodromas monacha TaxID=399045 RepID=A0A7R9BPL4_9CRUS|nr:unnamed protein product [Notodromas monacha]CAG0919304.1 unnamed protein product [Notodromas monacha]